MGKKSGKEIQKTLIRRMTANSRDTVNKVIHFTNDDVPKYLQVIDRFENRSSKTRIIVR